MDPTKDDPEALVELVDVLLRDGAVIQADVVVTVADVPLVGISLRAAVAGMTTMADYGLLADWDEAVRDRALEGGDGTVDPIGSGRPAERLDGGDGADRDDATGPSDGAQ